MAEETGLIVGTRKEGHALIETLHDRMLDLLNNDKDATARMVRVFQNAVSRNPRLLECTQASLMDSFLKATEFQLEPNTPLQLCFIIPYKNFKNKGIIEAQFQVGYQGLVTLAYRSGRVRKIFSEPVFEKDNFRIAYGLHPDLVHEPEYIGDPGKVLGYYAVVCIDGVDPIFRYMTEKEILAHAEHYSKSFKSDSSPWQDPFSRPWMCRKTVIIQACKLAPKSLDDKRWQFERALTADTDIDFSQSIEQLPASRGIPPAGRTLQDMIPPEFNSGEDAAPQPEPKAEPTKRRGRPPKQPTDVALSTAPEPEQPVTQPDNGDMLPYEPPFKLGDEDGSGFF